MIVTGLPSAPVSTVLPATVAGLRSLSKMTTTKPFRSWTELTVGPLPRSWGGESVIEPIFRLPPAGTMTSCSSW